MAAQPQTLTVEEFEHRYANEKPYYEYWYGQAIQKSMPTFLHSALQVILGWLLKEVGILSVCELELRIVPDARPLPDVAGFGKPVRGRYPTEPFEVAIEILSPADSMQHLMRKCRAYSEWGIQNVYVFDPEDRIAQKWNPLTGGFEGISEIAIEGRTPIPVTRIWSELDHYIAEP